MEEVVLGATLLRYNALLRRVNTVWFLLLAYTASRSDRPDQRKGAQVLS